MPMIPTQHMHPLRVLNIDLHIRNCFVVGFSQYTSYRHECKHSNYPAPRMRERG